MYKNYIFYYVWRLIQDAGVWTVGWFGRTQRKTTGKIIAFLALPFALIRILAGKLAGRLEIPYIDLVITTKCSLHCTECSNLMQYYGKPRKPSYHTPIESLITDMTTLLKIVDHVQTMTIIGGEPFLHPHLNRLLSFLCEEKKIRRIQIISNGTVVPDKNVINSCLKSKKVTVLISDYESAGVDQKNVISVLKKNHIVHKMFHPVYWRKYGVLSSRKRSADELNSVFRRCRIPNCRSLLNGSFYLCPRSSAGTDLGVIPYAEDDFVSLREAGISDIRKNLKRLLRKRDFIQACDYCDNSYVYPLQKVMPGEQLCTVRRDTFTLRGIRAQTSG